MGCWFPKRCEAQPNYTITSSKCKDLREDPDEGRGGLTEYVHTLWSTNKTELTSSRSSKQGERNTEAMKISCHIKKTQKYSRRERIYAQKYVQKKCKQVLSVA